MKLYFYGSESLSQTENQLIESPTEKEIEYLLQVEEKMLQVMNHFGVSGLAAPQIGEPLQMVVVKIAGGDKVTILNPEITRMYGGEFNYPESCISCPPIGSGCETPRMENITVVGRTIERPNKDKKWHLTSSDAMVVQHEIDHLVGTFFFERANLVAGAQVLERFHQWKKTFKNSGIGFPY